jgi:hypothetical protein
MEAAQLLAAATAEARDVDVDPIARDADTGDDGLSEEDTAGESTGRGEE